jgi:phosphoribosyl-ATP pyrophosphohydrolase
MSRDTLHQLAALIRDRRNAAADQSYTRQLLDAGPEKCAKKLGEEAAETIIAALVQPDDDLKNEAADLLYHLLVLLESRLVDFDDVLNKLEQRQGLSGLAEKAARPKAGNKADNKKRAKQ